MTDGEFEAQIHAALFKEITAPYKSPTSESIAASERYWNQKTTEYFERLIAEDPEFREWLEGNFVKVDAPRDAG